MNIDLTNLHTTEPSNAIRIIAIMIYTSALRGGMQYRITECYKSAEQIYYNSKIERKSSYD